MALEWIVLAGLWIAGGVALWFGVPRARMREAQISFLFFQMLTWLIDIFYVQVRWTEFPVREFRYATKCSFSLHFFVYPTIGALFIVRFPEQKSWPWKAGWYLLVAGLIAGMNGLLDRYTGLIDYIKWNPVWSFVTALFFQFLLRLFYRWFRKGLQT